MISLKNRRRRPITNARAMFDPALIPFEFLCCADNNCSVNDKGRAAIHLEVLCSDIGTQLSLYIFCGAFRV
jgi:hypothetical protein